MALHLRSVAKRTWFSALRVLLLLLIFLLFTVLWLVGTEGGRITLVNQGLGFWQLLSGQSVQLDGLRSPALGDWQVNRLHWQAADSGPAVTVENARLQWAWHYGVQNRWWLRRLEVERLHIDIDQPQQSGNQSVSELYALYSKLPALRIDRLHIEQISLQRPRYPILQADLDAQIEINWGAYPARFLIALQQHSDNNKAALHLSIDNIDQVRLRGSLQANPGTAWAAWLKWRLPEAAEAQWDVQIDYSQPKLLKVNVGQWSMPWQSYLLRARGEFSYQVDQFVFDFKPLHLDLDGQPATLQGTLAPKQSELNVDLKAWPMTPIAQLFAVTELDGQLSVAGHWQGGWQQPRFAGQIDANGHWREHDFLFHGETQSERSVLSLKNGRLTLANNHLALAGTLDWISDEIDLNVDGDLALDPVFRPWLGSTWQALTATATASARLQGPVGAPTLTLDARSKGRLRDDPFTSRIVGHWRQGVATIEQAVIYSKLLQLTGSGQYHWPGHDWQASATVDHLTTDVLTRLNIQLPVAIAGAASGKLRIAGTAANFNVQGDARFQGRWQDRPLNATTRIEELSRQRLSFADARLRLGQAQLNGDGTVDWSAEQLALDLEHKEWPLATIAAWMPFWPELLRSLQLDMTGNTAIHGHWTQPAIQTSARATGQWFGQAIKLALTTKPGAGGHWQVPQLSAQWLGAHWHYQGDFVPYQLELAGHVKLDHLHSRWLPLLSREFTGREQKLAPEFDLTLTASSDIRGKLTAPTLSGQADIQGKLSDEPMALKLKLARLDTQAIDITEANGTWGAGHWQLAGSYDWHVNEVAMKVATDSPDAYYLTPWLTLVAAKKAQLQWLTHWRGSLQGELSLDNRSDDWLISGKLTSTGRLYDEDYQLQWQGDGRLNEALSHQISATWGVADVSASLVSDADNIHGDVDVKWLNYVQLQHLWPTLPANLMGYINLKLKLDGAHSRPAYQAEMKSVGQFQAKYAHRFNTDITVSGQGADWSIARTVLEIPGAVSVSVSGQGHGKHGNILLEGYLPDTRYWITSEEIGAGEAGFRMDVKGDLTSPVLNGTFHWQSQKWPMSLSSQWRTIDDEYQIDATFISDQLPRVKADMTLSRLSLIELPTRWLSAPFAANLTLNTPLSVLDPFLVHMPDIRLAGDVEGELSLDGSLSDPDWDGKILWQHGQVEHANYGTQVANISAELQAKDQKWYLSSSASDQRAGTMKAAGTVDFFASSAQALAHRMNLKIEYDHAHLVNQAQLEASVDGDVKITGSYHNLLISGDITIDSLNMQTDTFLASGTPQLNIVTRSELLNSFEQQKPFYWPQGNWQTTLTAKQRVNLYGQGINAELEGYVRLSKDLYAPELSGQFDLIRGTYSGLGKIFQLTDGTIQIEHNQMVVDITGTNTVSMRLDGDVNPTSVEVTINITGNQDALTLSLTSDTDMGQDELLAQILFGKIIDDLDVLQAIQLANAVNKLRTGSSGFDLVGATREEMGLDSLAVDTATDDEGNLGFNISAGKYLNDFLYLEVEQQVGAERDSRGSLQYQLTPNTNIELYTQGENGEFDDNGLELNWSWDY